MIYPRSVVVSAPDRYYVYFNSKTERAERLRRI